MNTDTNAATGGSESETILHAEDVSVSYGKIQALRNLDITINKGELISLIGPNGAGKTTFADTLGGFLDYTGELKYKGDEIHEQKQPDLVSNGLIYCTEKRDLFQFMSVEQNLRMGGYRSRGNYEENLERVYKLFPKLEERRDQEAHTMSGGEQQMLAIGRALMGEPDFLILDEPTLGLAPVILQDISEAIDQITQDDVTVFLTEQNVTFALNHADKIYLIENGRIVKSGSPAEMQGDDYIQETYLGG
jgi:branched-chain amino acid transport system ATP-binding protein